MEPTTIATLTALALIGLAVEYFTRLLSRGIVAVMRLIAGSRVTVLAMGGLPGAAHGLPAGAGAAAHLELSGHEAPTSLAHSPVGLLAAQRTRAPLGLTGEDRWQPFGEPSQSLERLHPRTNGVALAVSPRLAHISPAEEARERTASEVLSIVQHLEALNESLGANERIDVRTILHRLKTLSLEYDLDELMELDNGELTGRSVSYYREVAATIVAIEGRLNHTQRRSAYAGSVDWLGRRRKDPREVIAEEISRGTELAQCLSPYPADVVR